MSFDVVFKRFRKPKPSNPAPLPDRTLSSASPASFSTPEIAVKTRPTVNIQAEAFPFETQVSWPPNKPKSNQHHTPAVQPQIPPVGPANSNVSVPATVKPEPPSQPRHPESLIPARKPSTSSSLAPNLIHIPIDSSPVFADVIFGGWKSDPNSGGKAALKSPKSAPINNSNGVVPPLSTNDVNLSDQPTTVPIGEYVKNGHRPSSPLSSEASSLYSYVSAPELECGDDDLYGYSSPRSYRLTRKDSTTLPQDLVWQIVHGPRGRDDDDDMRSRRSSTGKRSAKSRRNSDGGASVHTARRSKSKSKISADVSVEGGRSHSRSRTVKPKHPRSSSTSMSSSVLHSVSTSSTPSTITGFPIGTRPIVFPSPSEPMPAHAVQVVQAAQAIVGKGIANSNSDANIATNIQTEKNTSSSPSSSPWKNNSGPRSSLMEHLDSPSGDKLVTLAAVLEGYNHLHTRNRSNAPAHVYAFDQGFSNVRQLSPRKDAPPLPRDPPPEGLLPLPPPKPSGRKNQEKALPPVLLNPISHDKSQSESLLPHLGFTDRNQHERARSHPSQTSPSPSRPLPVTPLAAPVITVAGPSKPDQIPRKTICKSIRHVKESDRSLPETPSDTPQAKDIVLSTKQDKLEPQFQPPVEPKLEGLNSKRGAPVTKTASMSNGEITLPTLTIASSSPATRQISPESSTPSVQTSGISPSSSFPSSGNATSVSSVDHSVQQLVDSVKQVEPDTTVVQPESASSPEPSTKTKTTENKEGRDAQHLDGVFPIHDRGSKPGDLLQGDNGGIVPGSTLKTHLQTNVTGTDIQAITDNHDKNKISVEGIMEEGNIVRDGKTQNDSDGASLTDEKETLELYNTSDFTVKEDPPMSSSINTPISPPKQQDFNLSTDELGRSIHDPSVASIPWNASTGSIGSHRLKGSYYSNPNASLSASSVPLADAKSIRRRHAAVDTYQTNELAEKPNKNQSINGISPSVLPEHFPLPPSSSSIELPQSDDQRAPHDGRTSSPNVWRARPFSPDSMRSVPSHNVTGRHEQNRSVGDVSQAASRISVEVVKATSSLSNQRPSSRTSSALISINGTRNNRSSTLPTVDGVSPAPGPFQANRFSKATLPIGNKPVVGDAIHATRQRSGSEPQYPSLQHHRAAGRLSTIQQSPIQTTRPAPLPLRKDRVVDGSMTFPETPYEYTPIPTPAAQRIPGPRIRGNSFLSTQPRNASRLGSEFSQRRPAGPRPLRNFSSTKNPSSSKFASPPNTARSFDFEPGSDGGILPDFRPRPVEWRAYTLEAAHWTFTAEQLHEIFRQAIQHSSAPSAGRVLTPDVPDEIRPEIARLEILQQDITIRYCANVTRRRVILKSLRHNLINEVWAKRSQLTQELTDTSYLADQLTKDLFHTMHRLQTLHRLMDMHTSSGLVMAVRKLDSSIKKLTDEMMHVSRDVHELEEEKMAAWAVAERFEMEAMELRDKLEAMSISTPSSDSSSRRNSRKRSVRASKASFRLSRSTRLSNSSTSSNYIFASPPPVPPIPRLAHASNSRILSLNTDISLGTRSAHSAQSFAMSPTPESRALARAQKELYDILGFSSGPRKSIPPKRPHSEILSPVTASEAYLSPRAPEHHTGGAFLLRRNNSIPISPHRQPEFHE